VPCIDWNLISGPNDNLYTLFIDFLHDVGLTQFVTTLTSGAHLQVLVNSYDANVYWNNFVYAVNYAINCDNTSARFGK